MIEFLKRLWERIKLAFGIKTWDSSGTIQVDTGTRLTRLIATISLTSSDSGSVDYSAYGLTASNGLVMSFLTNASVYGQMPHDVYISGSSVYYTPASPYPTASTVLVFMYK